MKNLIITSLFAILTFAAQAQIIGTFTTSVEGGIKGEATALTPNFEMYSLYGDNDLNTVVFNENTVTGETTITITNVDGNENFTNFINLMTTSSDYLLRVGHTINGVKSRNASTIAGWFGENTDFVGETINQITITYSNVNFETTDNWTTFSYDMTMDVYTNSDVEVAAKANR